MKKFWGDYWFKLIIGIAILVVGVSISCYYLFILPAIQNRQIAVQQTNDLLTFQQECAQQAEVLYKQGNDTLPSSTVNSIDQETNIQDHYNTKLNKCFVLWTSTLPLNGLNESIYQELDDAFEGKEYADNFSNGFVGKIPVICHILIPAQPCNGPTDFENFTNAVMTQ